MAGLTRPWQQPCQSAHSGQGSACVRRRGTPASERQWRRVRIRLQQLWCQPRGRRGMPGCPQMGCFACAGGQLRRGFLLAEPHGAQCRGLQAGAIAYDNSQARPRSQVSSDSAPAAATADSTVMGTFEQVLALWSVQATYSCLEQLALCTTSLLCKAAAPLCHSFLTSIAGVCCRLQFPRALACP